MLSRQHDQRARTAVRERPRDAAEQGRVQRCVAPRAADEEVEAGGGRRQRIGDVAFEDLRDLEDIAGDARASRVDGDAGALAPAGVVIVRRDPPRRRDGRVGRRRPEHRVDREGGAAEHRHGGGGIEGITPVRCVGERDPDGRKPRALPAYSRGANATAEGAAWSSRSPTAPGMTRPTRPRCEAPTTTSAASSFPDGRAQPAQVRHSPPRERSRRSRRAALLPATPSRRGHPHAAGGVLGSRKRRRFVIRIDVREGERRAREGGKAPCPAERGMVVVA